jgi:hypothetical protein
MYKLLGPFILLGPIVEPTYWVKKTQYYGISVIQKYWVQKRPNKSVGLSLCVYIYIYNI